LPSFGAPGCLSNRAVAMLWTAALQALVATKELVAQDALDEAGKPKLPANFHGTGTRKGTRRSRS
jgi:hypothetical protein